jgi:hypothetical protein
MCDLVDPVFCRCKKYRQLPCKKGGFSVCFPLDVLMVHSSTLAISTDAEHLTCGGFSLGETIRFGSLQFITNCFGGLSLSPRRNDLGAPLMGLTHSGQPSPLWAMIDDSTEEFYIVSSRDGGFDLFSSRSHA